MCGCCPAIGDPSELPKFRMRIFRALPVLNRVFASKGMVGPDAEHQTATQGGRGGSKKHLTRIFDQFNAEDEAR